MTSALRTTGAPSVPRTRLAASGLALSRLGLGLSRLHHLGTERERRRLIETAIDVGMTHFDAARLYGDGLAERSLGLALSGRRASATIATKFGLLPDPLIETAPPSVAWLLRAMRSALRGAGIRRGPRRSFSGQALRGSLTASLRALRTDYVDVLLLHDACPAEVAMNDDLMQAVEDERSAGRLRFAGVATAYPHAETLLARTPHVFDVIQTPETQWPGGEPIPDITYGVLARGPQTFAVRGVDPADVRARLTRALARRRTGTVLVGTRNTTHLRQLADIAAASG